MRKLHTILSMLLAFMMIAGMLPTTVFAEEYGMLPVFEYAETEIEAGPVDLTEIPEEAPQDFEDWEAIESVISPQDENDFESVNAAAFTVKAPEWRMSDDKKTVFINQPVVTGGTGNYTYAYNLYNDQGQALNYFYSNDPAVAATFPGDCKAVMIIVVSDGVNSQTVYTDWFFIIGFEGKYGAKVTYSDAADIRMTVTTPENMQSLALYAKDTEAGTFTASQHSEVTNGVRVWDISLPNQNYAELVVKTGRNLGDLTYLEKVDVNHVEEPFTVQDPVWRMSEDKRTVFIEQPVVTGGTGNYTYAYNLYNDQGQALNYFYSNDPAVAATFPGDCKAVMIIVVSDGVESKTVYTDWFWITGFSEDYGVSVERTSGKVGEALPIKIKTPANIQYIVVNAFYFIFIWDAENYSVLEDNTRVWDLWFSSGEGTYECVFTMGQTLDDQTYLDKITFDVSAIVVEIIASGQCGENLTWTLDENGMLTISGTGAMDDYDEQGSVTSAPWGSYAESLTGLDIEYGVTSIGAYAFAGCSNLIGDLTIQDSVTTIGASAFSGCSSLDGEVIIPASVTSIGENAFTLTEFSTINLYRDSYADTWAQENGYTDLIHYIGEPDAEDDPVITKQPEDVEAVLNDIVQLTVEAENATGYRWQYSADGGITWTDLSTTAAANINVTSATAQLKMDTADRLTYQYRCAVYGANDLVIYSTAVSIVEPMPANVDGFTYELINNVMTITGYIGTDTVLTIPGEIDGVTVAALAESAFAGMTDVTSVYIPAGITTIAASAFDGCTGLTEVQLSNNVTVFGRRCFAGCTSLSTMNPYD